MPGLFRAGFSPTDEVWKVITERSRIFGLNEAGEAAQELAWIGLPPDEPGIAQGPLAAAAFKIAPPEKSVIYQVDWMGLTSDEKIIPVELAEDEADEAFTNLSRLNDRAWTFVRGAGKINVLVHERGSVDQWIAPPDHLDGSWEPRWPEGEDEVRLKSFVVDSRGLVEDAEFNRRRRGEGLPVIGFAWPWGQGLQVRLPNVAVRRGELIRYQSNSLRLKGIAQLSGYWHGELGQSLRSMLLGSTAEPTVVVHPMEGEEDAERFEHDLQELILDPFMRRKSDDELRLTILDPLAELGLNFDSRRSPTNTLPFDPKVKGDARLNLYPIHETILRALAF